jgi:regulatory protein
VSRDLDHALGVAYRYLDRRERTIQEVRLYLERKGVEAATVEQAVARLTGEGYLDDKRFARLYSQDKRTLEQWGSERIRRGLLKQGIDPELIAAALGETVDACADTELDRALGLLARRFPSPPRERRERDRALGLLIRKGYDPELALDALAAYARAVR